MKQARVPRAKPGGVAQQVGLGSARVPLIYLCSYAFSELKVGRMALLHLDSPETSLWRSDHSFICSQLSSLAR